MFVKIIQKSLYLHRLKWNTVNGKGNNQFKKPRNLIGVQRLQFPWIMKVVFVYLQSFNVHWCHSTNRDMVTYSTTAGFQ